MKVSGDTQTDTTTPVAGRSRIRVLVVDGDERVLESLTAWLEGHPEVEVCGFATAGEALNQERRDSYDLCLLDYRLGSFDGVMLGAMIRALNPGARLVLMTAALNSRIERQAFEHGFHSVLAKPFPPRKLTEVILGDAA
jgi:CheY-like chemotaxis protein